MFSIVGQISHLHIFTGPSLRRLQVDQHVVKHACGLLTVVSNRDQGRIKVKRGPRHIFSAGPLNTPMILLVTYIYLKYILRPKDFLSFDPPKPLKATIIFLLLVKYMPTRFQN